MTNDGDLASRLMHPRYGVAKTYSCWWPASRRREDVQKLLDGVWLSDGKVRATARPPAQAAGRQHLAADRADRGEEPRNPPDARQARATR